jgi:membrane fusion protein (multidrug efflux system)
MYRLFPVIIYCALASGLLSCRGKAVTKNEETATPVTIIQVKSGQAVFYNSYPANIVALKEVELRGQVSGYITGIYFNEGKRVRSGQKLYEIDRRKYQAAYEVAQSNVKIAVANLKKVQQDADRYTELVKEDAVAKQLLDHAVTDLNNARQQVENANSEMIKARTDFEYSLIKAPFEGTIGFSNVKLGALITPGSTLLNTISADDSLGVDFEINEKELRRFQEMATAATSKNDSTFSITMPDNSIYPHSGRISVIDRAVDPQTGSIRIRIVIPNTERILKPGMSCKVMALNAPGLQILIPYKAVMEQLGEYFVFAVHDNKAAQVKITLGPKVASNVIVLKGLNEGDNIVVDGIQKLHDGSAVKVSLLQ